MRDRLNHRAFELTHVNIDAILVHESHYAATHRKEVLNIFADNRRHPHQLCLLLA